MKALNAVPRLSLGALLLAAPLALAGDLGASATSTAACCQLTTTLASEAIRPRDIPGDERFFMSEGAPPNIHFLVDTSGSMKELPQIRQSDHDAFYLMGDTDAFDPTHTGCNNTALLAVQQERGWNKDTVYEVPDTGTGIGSDNGHPNLFRDDRYYAYMKWDDSSSPTPDWATKEDACKAQYPRWNTVDSARYANCLTCLQERGFFKKPGVNDYRTSSDPASDTRKNFIFWGRFLNFNPPKYVTAKVVLKQVIKDLSRVRAGISTFHWASNSADHGASMVRGQNPSCNQLLNDSSAFDNNRASYISAVDGLRFNTGTPLAKALLNIGQYFSSSDDVYQTRFGFTDYRFKNSYSNGSLNSQSRSWCWGCQHSSVIVITDGDPTGDTLPPVTRQRIRELNGGPVVCSTASDCLDDEGNDSMFDDVAKFLATQDLQQHTPAQVGDLDTTGRQSMSIYTIGFGIDSKLLANAAQVADGAYYTANDANALKDAILEIIRAVETRATAFSSAAVASLQVNSAGGALVPRFKPSKSAASPWQGFLYRFSLAPEVLLGCTEGGSAGDLNGDGDCDDIHLLDAEGNAVIEDAQGNFVRLDNPSTPAKPFWEAGAKLKPLTSGRTAFWKTRRIYTIIDNGSAAGDGVKDNRIDAHDTPIAFVEENAAQLLDYLGISANPDECAALAGKLGLASLPPLECAKLVIRYYRGADVLNPDPSQREFDRPFLLHDIFHSSPVSVEPPTPRFFCGLSNQCLDTLHSGRTERATYDTGDGQQRDAYDEWFARYGDRDKVVLVGSNGGMLHAFHNGRKTGEDAATGLFEYDAGTGEELWAFIPPDLLPRLREKLGVHAYFVDGTPMVRDVWLDGVGSDAVKDGKKQASEYRTIAVVGTGSGGVHRFALDLTGLIRSPGVPGQAQHRPPERKGDFLWMWPQPCDPLATQLGESFSNFAPKPPPIGPVAMYDPDGPWKVGPEGAQRPAREQWVVFLNGGYDPYMVRGRGMALVDLKTGETLWSFFHGDDTTKRPLADKLRYPIAAGAAMLDLGNAPGSTGDADLLFDTAIIADYGGQVWTVRFWLPGERDTSGGSAGQVKNWFAARSFQVAMNDAQRADERVVRPPFSYIASNTLQPDTGYLRTFLGTGDRYNLVDAVPQCRLSNPRACAELGCAVSTRIQVHRDTVEPVSHGGARFADYKYADLPPPSATSEGNACRSPKVTLQWDMQKSGVCDARSGKLEYACSGDAETWSCASSTNDWVDLKLSGPAPAGSTNRFYGFWSYGVDSSRTFNTAAEALVYDNRRLRDSDLVDVSQFNATGEVVAASERAAGSLDKGWLVRYTPSAERTGSGSTVIDGCVIWNSFEPSSNSSAVCSTTATNTARTYQASFVSGKADCAASFVNANTNLRYVASATVGAPPEPAPQRTLVNGKVYSSAILPGVGGGGGSGNQQFVVGENKEVLQSIYQIELDPAAHACRHEGRDCK